MEKPVIEGKELRNIVATELRTIDGGNGKRKIEGYAAVFNEMSEDIGGFQEKIADGAFSSTIQNDDIMALWNHNADYPLGRNKAGTLTLEEDNKGLRFVIDPPDTQYSRDLIVSIDRGDVDQMSFGFRTIKDHWEMNGDKVVRTLIEVKLYDVSPVTYPAYPQTSAAVRSKLEEFTQADQVAMQEAKVKAAQVRNLNRKRKLQILSV
jgi:HK97 family phage prohead protease